MGGKMTLTAHIVTGVQYRVWEKRTDPDAPRTVRVDYEIGFGKYVTEWVCPEHSGYAFERFCKWWAQRCELEPPETAEEAVSIAESKLLAVPRSVTVREKPGQRYPAVVKVELGDIPAAESAPGPIPPAPACDLFSQYGDTEF